MSNNKVTLDDWLKEEHQRIENFAAMWKLENTSNPENWPNELEPGEWDEQLRAYESMG